jgi:hypothetical protein
VVAPDTLSTGGENISRLATGLGGLPLMGGHRLQLLADSEVDHADADRRHRRRAPVGASRVLHLERRRFR